MLRILFLAFLGGFCHLFIKSAKATFVYMLWTLYSENIIIDIKIFLAIRYFLKICNFCQKMESQLIFVRILKLKLNHSFVFCFLNEFHTVVSIISSWVRNPEFRIFVILLCVPEWYSLPAPLEAPVMLITFCGHY